MRQRIGWQWLRIGSAAAAFIGFGVGAWLLSVLVLPIVSLVTRDREQRVRRCQRIVQAAFRLFHDCMRGAGLVDWNPRSPGLRLPDYPVVVIANHPTLVDITALVSAFGPVCYLAKRSLFRNPLVGPLLRWCEQIPSAGGTLYEGVQVIDQALDRMMRGHSVLLFPEGTRSKPGDMQRFHAGAFEIARRAGVPLLPIVVRVEPAGLYRGLAWYQIPTRTMSYRVEQLPEFAISSGAVTSDVRKQVEATMRERLNSPML